MKKIVFLLVLIAFISCKNEGEDPDRFKTGLFEIPAGQGYDITYIERQDSIQIETYKSKVDTLSIIWKNNFNYTLKMLNPKSAIDEEPIHVKITTIRKESYEFEAVIGHSNYIQKGEIFKKSK